MLANVRYEFRFKFLEFFFYYKLVSSWFRGRAVNDQSKSEQHEHAEYLAQVK